MQEYRERAQQVRAIQVTEANLPAIVATPGLTIAATYRFDSKGQPELAWIDVSSDQWRARAIVAGWWLVLFPDGAINAWGDEDFHKKYEPVERPADAIRHAATRHALTEQIAKGLRAEFLLYGGETFSTSRDWRDTNEAVRQQYRADALERFPYLAPEAE